MIKNIGLETGSLGSFVEIKLVFSRQILLIQFPQFPNLVYKKPISKQMM